MNPADIPSSLEKAEALLARHGMKAEKVNLGEVMPDLNIYKRLTPAQVQKFKKGMQNCHYWIITLDSTKQEREEDALAGQKTFEMQYNEAEDVPHFRKWGYNISKQAVSISLASLKRQLEGFACGKT